MSKIIAQAEALNKGETYRTGISVRQHLLVADELASDGGTDLGPAPGDFLCAALASCKAITIRMYANRKNWPLEDVKVSVHLVKGESLPSGHNTFFSEITLTGNLSEEQRTRIMEVTKACPIQRLLLKSSEMVNILKETPDLK